MSSASRPCPFCKGTGVYHDPVATAPRELRWTLASDRDTGSRVTLVGEVTEQASLERLLDLPRPVILELSGVRYVNTMGAQQLVRLIEGLGGAVVAERCSPAVVRQLNLMPDFSDHVRVASAQVPYECPTCHVDHAVIVELSGKRPNLPPCRCGTCDGLLQPDEPADQYFAFLPA